MDLWRPVAYRGVQLNDARRASGSSSLNVGVALERVVFGAVQGVGYTEKRSLADGRDASDVYLESRRIQLAGTIYGTTRSEAFDHVALIRTVCSPTGAYTSDPGDYGYLPLSWQEPTTDPRFTTDPVNGLRYRDMHSNVRPLTTPQFDIVRDRLGGLEDRGAGIPWSVQFEAIDPRLYGDTVTNYLTDIDNAAHTASVGTLTLLNRGDYPSPVKILFLVAANQPLPGYAKFTIGGSIMRIGIPKSVNQQIFRYDGVKKVLTIEEQGLEVLRMDQLVFLAESTHPLVPSGSTQWSWTTLPADLGVSAATYAAQPIGADPNSRMWFDEAYV